VLENQTNHLEGVASAPSCWAALRVDLFSFLTVFLARLASLGLELSFTLLVSLILVDGLDEDVLVLVHVTLGSEVHLSVLGRSDLLGLSVLAEESSENSGSAHP